LEIVQQFKFHTRVRKDGETLSDYVAELCSLAEFCNFKDSLEVMLWDRLVCGINDEGTQKKLLTEATLTYLLENLGDCQPRHNSPFGDTGW